jgi:hypothetical protein
MGRPRSDLRLTPLREGTFKAGSHTVYFQDGDTLRDAADLYATLKEDAGTGSPNLENELVRSWVQALQRGEMLSNTQLAKLLELLDKYRDEIQAYREDPDQSQDILDVPDGNEAHIVR